MTSKFLFFIIIPTKNNNLNLSNECPLLKEGFEICHIIARWVSISAFASLLGIPIGIIISAIGLKNCAMAAGIKKY